MLGQASCSTALAAGRVPGWLRERSRPEPAGQRPCPPTPQVPMLDCGVCGVACTLPSPPLLQRGGRTESGPCHPPAARRLRCWLQVLGPCGVLCPQGVSHLPGGGPL